MSEGQRAIEAINESLRKAVEAMDALQTAGFRTNEFGAAFRKAHDLIVTAATTAQVFAGEPYVERDVSEVFAELHEGACIINGLKVGLTHCEITQTVGETTKIALEARLPASGIPQRPRTPPSFPGAVGFTSQDVMKCYPDKDGQELLSNVTLVLVGDGKKSSSSRNRKARTKARQK